MEPTKPEPGPMGVALLAGGLTLLAGPFALATLLGVSLRGEDGAFAGLAQVVNEGGLFSYAVLLAGAAATVAAAVLMLLSVRRPALPAAVAVAPFLMPLLVALGGTVASVGNVLAAVVHAAPADRRIILVAATGELMSLELQALAFAVAGCFACGLGALGALAAPGRAPRLVSALGAVALGLSLGGVLARAAGLRLALLAVAHVDPADRLTLLAAVLDELSPATSAANVLLLVSLAVAVAGGVLVSLEGERVAGIGTAVALVVAALGFRGSAAMTERQLAAVYEDRSLAGPPPWAPLDGRAGTCGEPVDLAAEPTLDDVADAVSRGVSRWSSAGPCVSLGLTDRLKRGHLVLALQAARSQGALVELAGAGPRVELSAPPMYRALVEAVGDVPRSVPVRVLYQDEVCEGCAGAVALTAEGLSFTPQEGPAQAWKRERELPLRTSALPGVELDWQAGVDELSRAALVALSHQHLLVVRVPSPPRE